jgi:hypothetical protein
MRLNFIHAILFFLLTITPAYLPGEVASAQGHPDRVLFKRGMLAVKEKKLDVAHLTFQTLINTYPKSKYAQRAKKVMENPKIGTCAQAWSNPLCTDYSQGVSSPDTKNH